MGEVHLAFFDTKNADHLGGSCEHFTEELDIDKVTEEIGFNRIDPFDYYSVYLIFGEVSFAICDYVDLITDEIEHYYCSRSMLEWLKDNDIDLTSEEGQVAFKLMR